MPKMSASEVDAFLNERGHLVRLGTIDADGMPRVVPTWFIYRDGMIQFTPRGPSVFLANLRRDPRIGLSIDEDALPYRKVTVQGEAKLLFDLNRDDEWRDTYREIACRYIPDEAADDYIRNTVDQPRALLGVPLVGSKTQSWRMPLEEEPRTGIWARRYYLDGTFYGDEADKVRP